MENGARTDLRDFVARSALMFAASGPFPGTVQRLLDAGAEVDAVEAEEGFTALMYAAAEGHLEVVRILLAGGANRDLRDMDGDVARDFAVRSRHPEVARLLAGD